MKLTTVCRKMDTVHIAVLMEIGVLSKMSLACASQTFWMLSLSMFYVLALLGLFAIRQKTETWKKLAYAAGVILLSFWIGSVPLLPAIALLLFAWPTPKGVERSAICLLYCLVVGATTFLGAALLVISVLCPVTEVERLASPDGRQVLLHQQSSSGALGGEEILVLQQKTPLPGLVRRQKVGVYRWHADLRLEWRNDQGFLVNGEPIATAGTWQALQTEPPTPTPRPLLTDEMLPPESELADGALYPDIFGEAAHEYQTDPTKFLLPQAEPEDTVTAQYALQALKSANDFLAENGENKVYLMSAFLDLNNDGTDDRILAWRLESAAQASREELTILLSQPEGSYQEYGVTADSASDTVYPQGGGQADSRLAELSTRTRVDVMRRWANGACELRLFRVAATDAMCNGSTPVYVQDVMAFWHSLVLADNKSGFITANRNYGYPGAHPRILP